MSIYNLEERTMEFAIAVRKYVKTLERNIGNYEDSKQVIRSSGSIGANYIEANEALGEKDRLMKLRISRKEAKETFYWLTLIKNSNDLHNDSQILYLVKESSELLKIFSSIIEKLKSSKSVSP